MNHIVKLLEQQAQYAPTYPERVAYLTAIQIIKDNYENH